MICLPAISFFRAGVPVAIIDFDAAAAGRRAEDLGYAAWHWLDLGLPDIRPITPRRRYSLFIAAYGGQSENLHPAIRQGQA